MILTKEMLGDRAFADCESLESIVIPEGVTSIAKFIFANCESLKSIVIPEGVTNIGNGAFLNCKSLESIVIPEGVTNIGERAFADCKALKNIVIPEGVTNIGEGTFADCKALKNIVIPEGVTNIKGCAFANCESLESIVIPEGVTNIGQYAFTGCKSLESIVIPEGVTNIGERAFADCKSLESIVIPEGVTNIGQFIFTGCKSLESIVIPEGVTNISAEAFSGCTATIYCNKQEYKYISPDLRPMSEGLLTNLGEKNWVRLSTQLLKLGIHPFHENKWVKPTEEEVKLLGEAFKIKFHRVPKLVADIATAIKIYNISIEEVIKDFSVESFKEALKKSDNNAFVAIIALIGAGGDLLHKFPINVSYELGVSHPVIRNWVRKHPESFGLLPKLKGLEGLLTEDTSVSEVKNLLAQVRATSDLEKIEKEYAFDFAQVKCEIKSTSVSKNSLSAYILEPTDYRQVTIGYDTCCCQHYGGAGETAMLYGLMCPTAGFWVIEDKRGEVKAQAEVWLSSDNQTFVFDNIEFANNRQVSDFERIIKEWVATTPYPNVVLGMGYTALSLPCPECQTPPQPEVKDLWAVYTDTHRCVQLKRDGKLTW